MHEVALFFHILGALAFVSGIVVAGVAFESARRRDDPQDIALLLGLSRVGVLLVAPGAVLLLAFGLRLVDAGGYGWGTGWIDAALVLFAVTVALGALGGQTPKRARLLATKLAEGGQPVSPALRKLLDEPVSRAANYLAAAVVVSILVLMVFKP